jgi:TolA-binding protein
MSTPLVRTLLAVPLLAAGCVSPTWLPHPWRSEEVARPIDEAREEAKATAGEPGGSRGEVPGDPAETLYRLGLRQADPTSGIRDYRAARATFTELLSRYPHSRRDAEARAWQATLTDLLVREDDARRALLRLQRSEEDKKRTKANLEWLRQNDLDLERRK